MNYLIALELRPPKNSLDYVKQLAGLRNVKIDEKYGLVLISIKRSLYVVRVSGALDIKDLMSAQREVKGVQGDLKVQPFDT